MSLLSELNDRDSPIKRFFRETFPNTREPLSQVHSALRGNELIHWLEPGASSGVYALSGMAIDYRIRYSFAPTPVPRLVAWRGAWAISDTPPSGVPPRVFDQVLDVLADIRWLVPQDAPVLAGSVTADFFSQLQKTVARIAPHQRAPTPSEERRLARFCLLLAGFEGVSRAGIWPPPFLRGELPTSTADLLSAVPDDWVEDVAALATAFSERYPEWRGTPAALNPTFTGSGDIGGADADFILDGCLWDIKTTKVPKGKSIWIHQLLGFALLDYDDQFGIDRVGLLFPRQDTVAQWPLPKLIATLSGRSDLDLRSLRQRFRAIIADSR